MTSLNQNEQKLLQACSVLFGPQINLSPPFLNYIQLAGVKNAYRSRVKENHPDVTSINTTNPPEHDFFQVQDSYRQLCQFLAQRAILSHPSVPTQPTPNTSRSAPRRRPSSSQSSTRQKASFLPPRPMMFGEFLCHSGYCTWSEFHKALAWQRQGRPRLGEIGRAFGWLTHQDIMTVLSHHCTGNLFGETAERLGLLTAEQVACLLRHQAIRQQKIEQYLLRHNLVNPQQLQEALWCWRRHNFLARQDG